MLPYRRYLPFSIASTFFLAIILVTGCARFPVVGTLPEGVTVARLTTSRPAISALLSPAAIRRSNHCGAAGLHVERLAEEGLVALLLANTPEAIARVESSYTGQFLDPVLRAGSRADPPR